MKKQTREQSLVKSNKAPEEVGFYASLIFLFAHRRFWFSNVIYCLHSTFIEMIEYMLLMLCLVHWYNLYTLTTSMLLIHEQSSPHTLMYLVDIYIMLPLSLLSWIIKYLLEFSCTCMALDMLWYYWWNCVRGIPPRTRVILLMNLCEGSPPKITYGTNWWWPQCGTRYMHASCRIHKLFMPLHATWCTLKFPAICPPVVKCF